MQVNVNNQAKQPAPMPADMSMGGGMRPQQPMQPQYPKASKAPWIILAIVIIVVILGILGYAFRFKLMAMFNGSGNDLSGYQSVFLTNGQVYFGRISHVDDDYVRLTDIYYLQVNQTLQPTGAAAQTTTNQQPQLSLVKLGNELHGPTDQMEINRSQILFYEDMKADGKVAEAIQAYKAQNGTASTSTTGSTVPATTPAGK